MQLTGDAGADVAEAHDDDVATGRPRRAAHGTGQPGTDDDGGHHRDEGQAVEGQQHLRDLLDPAVTVVGDRRPGQVHHREVDRVGERVTDEEQRETHDDDGEHQAQGRVEFLGPQARVEVPDVVLPDDGQRPGGLDVRVGEGLAAELGVLEHADTRQRGDLRPVVPQPGRQQDGHRLAVPGAQFLGDAIGQRPVAADDEVIAMTIRAPRKRRHAAILVAGSVSETRLL
jgi:hypothetical protein